MGAVLGGRAGAILVEFGAARNVQGLVNQLRLDMQNIAAAGDGMAAGQPDGMAATTWNSVVTAGQQAAAAKAAFAEAISAAFETYLNTVLPLKLRNEELLAMREALELLQDERQEEVRLQCVDDLALQP